MTILPAKNSLTVIMPDKIKFVINPSELGKNPKYLQAMMEDADNFAGQVTSVNK